MKREFTKNLIATAGLCLCGLGVFAQVEESLPSVRELSKADYDAGIVLARVGTGETFDFAAPADAVVYSDWETFGAARDWFTTSFGKGIETSARGRVAWTFKMARSVVASIAIFSHGTVRPAITNALTCVSPLDANLGIVPKANHGLLNESDRPSRFWYRLTLDNTMILTWQNVLLDRDVKRPVSFQAEIEPNGTITFRYDLSRLAEDEIENVRVGILNDGKGRLFTKLSRNTTSLRWAYLNPAAGVGNDHDGDGVKTADEIFTYYTDPYSKDTDGDGLDDYCEIHEAKSDPRKSHSVEEKYNDYYAYVLGGLDPYSKPNRDGFTALENIFYTGSPNGKTKLPQSDASHAVLAVTAGNVGCGNLKINGVEVPALVGVDALKISVPRGLKLPWSVLGGVNDWQFNSEDYCVGEKAGGWVAFPNVEATHPCIHTVDGSEKIVSLNPGVGIKDLVCTWTSADAKDVSVETLTPLSAKLSAHFKRNSRAFIKYTLSHPNYLCGNDTFEQKCEYCPKIEDEDDKYKSTNDYIEGEDRDEEIKICPRHNCAYCYCLYEHFGSAGEVLSADPVASSNEYVTATNSTAQFSDVLKYRRPVELNEKCYFKLLNVTVPAEKFHCCECPEHWSSYASIGFKSHRLAVHLNGEPFVRTNENCTLKVYGTMPSEAFSGDHVNIRVNNGTAMNIRYTVLGVGIHSANKDLSRLNALSPSFGLPIMLSPDSECETLDKAETIQLATDVLLPSGSIHLAFEDAKAHFQLWMRSYDGQYKLVLDSATKPSLDMSIGDWGLYTLKATSKRLTDMKLIALPSESGDSHGSVRLFFGYAGGSGGKYLHDEVSQVITAIRPPLLPDYNRNGIIDDADELLYISGKRLYFWANEDTWSGDDAFAPYSEGVHIFAYQLPINGSDGEVNGRNDLVNLCPFAVDVTRISNIFGVHNISVSVTGNDLDNVQFVGTRTAWNAVGKIVSEDQTTVKNKALHAAKFDQAAIDDTTGELCYRLPTALLLLGSSGSGVLAMEFAKPNSETKLNLVVRKSDSGEVIFSQSLDASILDVHKMYRWINLDYVCEEQKPESDKTDEDRAREKKYKTRTDVEWPDTEHADVNVFFAHGFNVHIDEAWDWSQAMFKRLWWSGMNAGFTAIRWYGNHSQIWIPKVWPFITSNGYGSRNYHQNVYNAFRTAGTLATVANSLPGERKYYIAHSLGNMLICAAKQFHGLKYDKYMMLNAAVAMEALDPDAIKHENGKACMTPAVWRSYPDRVKSAHWYELFSQSDVRHGLTWKGLFKDVDNVMNFYSEQDEVVRDGNGKWKNPLSRKFAWYNQERAKGSFWVDSNWEAGWAFCDNYDIIETGGLWGNTTYARHRTSTESKSISNDQLISDPFFGAFTHPEILGENGDAYFTEHPEYRWRILSHGIPSESFAIGANAVTNGVVKASGYKKGKHSSARAQNIDMSTQCVREKSKHIKWVHSYFIQWSMKYTGILYDEIVANSSTTKGNCQ